jgi:hypothetical protein
VEEEDKAAAEFVKKLLIRFKEGFCKECPGIRGDCPRTDSDVIDCAVDLLVATINEIVKIQKKMAELVEESRLPIKQ